MHTVNTCKKSQTDFCCNVSVLGLHQVDLTDVEKFTFFASGDSVREFFPFLIFAYSGCLGDQLICCTSWNARMREIWENAFIFTEVHFGLDIKRLTLQENCLIGIGNAKKWIIHNNGFNSKWFMQYSELFFFKSFFHLLLTQALHKIF